MSLYSHLNKEIKVFSLFFILVLTPARPLAYSCAPTRLLLRAHSLTLARSFSWSYLLNLTAHYSVDILSLMRSIINGDTRQELFTISGTLPLVVKFLRYKIFRYSDELMRIIVFINNLMFVFNSCVRS